MTVRDAIQTDLDNRVNNLLIQKYGRDMESRDETKSGVKIMYYMSKYPNPSPLRLLSFLKLILL